MRRLLSGLLALVLAASLTACGQPPLPEDGKTQVVCTLFPYYDFARQIGGDDVDVTLVVPAGRETHSFEPTPMDVIRISQADVFIYNGGESEQWVTDILDAAGEDIPCVLSMMDAAELHEEELVEGMQSGTSAHDHHDHDEDGEEIEYDEHIWTSPVTAMALCRAITDGLCQADPDHADSFRARLADYLAALETLDGTFRQIVAEGSRDLLVFGDRFPLLYFCREYGLDYRAAFHGCAGDTEPSLATLKYLIDLVDEQHIPVVYTIELSSRKVAKAIAETTGAQVRTFHSCQTVSRAEFDAGVTYLQLMEANADVLREGLS
jgi:zinc transport system substrate-binding protein